MTTTIAPQLAERIEAAVLATPGVRSVYRAGSLVANLVEASAVALGVRADAEPVVSVVVDDGGVHVEASIGVEYTVPAAATLRDVRAAIESVLSADALRSAGIVVTIAYVHPRETS